MTQYASATTVRVSVISGPERITGQVQDDEMGGAGPGSRHRSACLADRTRVTAVSLVEAS